GQGAVAAIGGAGLSPLGSAVGGQPIPQLRVGGLVGRKRPLHDPSREPPEGAPRLPPTAQTLGSGAVAGLAGALPTQQQGLGAVDGIERRHDPTQHDPTDGASLETRMTELWSWAAQTSVLV